MHALWVTGSYGVSPGLFRHNLAFPIGVDDRDRMPYSISLPFIYSIFSRLVLGLPIFFFLKPSWRLDVVVSATSIPCADVNLARFQLEVLDYTPPARSFFHLLLLSARRSRHSSRQSGTVRFPSPDLAYCPA